jgi:hypothetical protein
MNAISPCGLRVSTDVRETTHGQRLPIPTERLLGKVAVVPIIADSAAYNAYAVAT